MTTAAGGDARVLVTFFRDEFASKKEEQHLALTALAELIERQSAPTKAGLPWLKLATFGNLPTKKNSLRWDGNLLEITGVEADYDGGRISFDEAVEIAGKAGLRGIIYTSPSYTPEKPRWRVVCPTSIKLPPTQRSHLLNRLNGLYGGIFAAESWTLSQSYYFGSIDHNPDHRVEIVEGQEIDKLEELDQIAIGKPATKTGNGVDPSPGGHADEQALIKQIVTGDSYHTAAIRLLGLWAHRGVAMLDAEKQLRGLFESVFPLDRDDRWQKRVNEIPRLLEHVWGKEAGKPDKRDAEDDRPVEYSDESLALRFAAQHVDIARYVALWSKWILWTEAHWRFDDTLRAFDMARAICRRASAEITAPKSVKLAAAVASARTVAAVVTLARADRRHAVTSDLWDRDLWTFTTKGNT